MASVLSEDLLHRLRNIIELLECGDDEKALDLLLGLEAKMQTIIEIISVEDDLFLKSLSQSRVLNDQ